MLKNLKFPWRIAIIISAVILGLVVVAARLLYMQVSMHETLQKQGDARSVRERPIPATRGIITDRNGEPLAVSSPVVSIWTDPRILVNEPNRWPELAKALHQNPEKLAERIQSNAKKGFIYLEHKLTPEEADKVIALRIPGVRQEVNSQRFYPAGEVAAHVVGFAGADENGQEGIELAFNDSLEGIPGRRQIWQDRYQEIIRDVQVLRNPRQGNQLALSIDMRLQYLAHRELRKTLDEFKAKAGTVVIVDVKTGEILAIANHPTYNPNNRSNMHPQMMRNRALTDVFEPGSTVKPFSIAAALETGRWNTRSTVDARPGHMRLRGGHTIKDVSRPGVFTLAQVLMKSSNVGISKIALDVGGETLYSMMSKVGFGQDTGLSFPGEQLGSLQPRRKWPEAETATLSYGYGLSVTAVQLAHAYAVFGNGGVSVPLSIIQRDEAPQGERVMSEKVAAEVLDMLRQVVEVPNSGGNRAKVEGYTVGGKSGTAKKTSGRGYADRLYRSFFAGIAPLKDPRISIVVVVDEPDPDISYYGGRVAAPLFSNIAAGSMQLLNIMPDALPEGTVVTKGRP